MAFSFVIKGIFAFLSSGLIYKKPIYRTSEMRASFPMLLKTATSQPLRQILVQA